MENITPLLILAGGLLVGLLMRFGRRSGDDDGTGNLDGIDTIAGTERDRIDAERSVINVERAIIESERDELRLEREQLERERSINDRASELLTELKRRADIKEKS